MPFNRSGDTGATYPALMKVAGLPGVDSRTINEVAGFIWRLSNLSSAHLRDYLVDAGTVSMIANGDENERRLLKLCARTGLLTKTRDADRLVAYKLIDDPEFIHMRLKAEIEWERQQRADAEDPHLTLAVRFRDGDQCRWCGIGVQFRGRTSARGGTYDHLNPGEPGTPATVVVACKRCNSGLRDLAGEDRPPLRDAPAEPMYRWYTAEWLNANGHNVEPSEPRPGSQPDPAKPKITRTARRQRPSAQLDTASTPTGDSDPATAGSRAPDTGAHTGGAGPPANAAQQRDTQDIGTSSVGTGRDGSGSARGSARQPATTTPANRRPRRSPRGRNSRGAEPS